MAGLGLITTGVETADLTGAGTGTLTPTASVMTFTCDEALALTIGVPLTAGQQLTVINLSAYDATVAETNVEITATAPVLGQYSSVKFVATSATQWVQVGYSDNTPA